MLVEIQTGTKTIALHENMSDIKIVENVSPHLFLQTIFFL